MEQYRKISDRILSSVFKFSRSSRGKYGFPFILLMVLGSFGLKEFTTIKIKYRDNGLPLYEQAKQAGIEMKKPGEVTLESVYDSVKTLDLEHWENKRPPRPWDENA